MIPETLPPIIEQTSPEGAQTAGGLWGRAGAPSTPEPGRGLTPEEWRARAWDRLKAPARSARQAWRWLQDAPRRRAVSLEQLQTLAPIFVIGGNRSGTSVVSSILSQHPGLEGLFTGALESSCDDGGHAQAFCRSPHVWGDLIPRGLDWRLRANRELPFWSLPHYLSGLYRHRARHDRERFRLAWAVARLRQMERPPLINDHFNLFRVGLIMDVFPRARFILTMRSWRDFLGAGLHKWTHDRSRTTVSAARPRAGLHWHLANLIARYDLESFAPGRYAVAKLEALHQGPESARAAFEQILRTLQLSPWAFDLRTLEPFWSKHRPSPSAGEALEERDFELVRQIVGFERDLLRSMGKP